MSGVMRSSSLITRAKSLSSARNLVLRRTFSTNAKEAQGKEVPMQAVKGTVHGDSGRRVGQVIMCVWIATCFSLPVINFRYQQSKL